MVKIPSLRDFVAADSGEDGGSGNDLGPDRLEALLEALALAERPRSIRVFLWLLLHTVRSRDDLFGELLEAWMPNEADLAQLLEDAGGEGTRTVLHLAGARGRLGRLWQLCEDAGVDRRMKTRDRWEVASLAPMAALVAEQQLDELIRAVEEERPWSDPAEILSHHGDKEFDLDALVGLAQARMVRTEGGAEALHVVTLRLLGYADRIH